MQYTQNLSQSKVYKKKNLSNHKKPILDEYHQKIKERITIIARCYFLKSLN
jgi:hypothetical protein